MNTAFIQKQRVKAAVMNLEDALQAAYPRDGIKPVWTPFALASEMLTSVDVKEKDILVLCDLGFLWPLKQAGADFSRVWVVVLTEEQASLATKMKVRAVLNIGYNKPIEELEKQLMQFIGLKFGIIVGNPPYQSADERRDGSLWPEFIKVSYRYLAPEGTIGMIVPSSWMSDDTGVLLDVNKNVMTVSGLRRTIFDNLHISTVAVGAHLNEMFPTVNLEFSYFIAQNTLKPGLTVILSDAGECAVDVRKMPFIPNKCSADILSILQKTIFSDLPKYEVHKGTYRFRVKDSKITRMVQNDTFKFPFVSTSAKYTKGQYGFSSEDCPHRLTPKVVWSNSGYNAPFIDKGKFGLGDHSSAIYAKGDEAESIKWIIEYSKLFKFLASLKAVGGFVLGFSNIQHYVPKLKSFEASDEALYRQFNLTKAEIALIEQATK